VVILCHLEDIEYSIKIVISIWGLHPQTPAAVIAYWVKLNPDHTPIEKFWLQTFFLQAAVCFMDMFDGPLLNSLVYVALSKCLLGL